MFIGDDWMVDLMIIYIEKTIAKALDISDIINFLWECQLNESKSLDKWSNSTTYWNLKIKYTLDIPIFRGQPPQVKILAPSLGLWPPFVHSQLHRELWPLDCLRNRLILLAIVNRWRISERGNQVFKELTIAIFYSRMLI